MSTDDTRKVTESLQNELRQRGEQIVQLSGAMATALNKQANVHATLQRSAKQFAALQPTIDQTSQLLAQLDKLNDQLRDQTALLIESVARVPIVLETSDSCAALCRSIVLPATPDVLPDAPVVVVDNGGSFRSKKATRRASTDVLRMAFDPDDDGDGGGDDNDAEVVVIKEQD